MFEKTIVGQGFLKFLSVYFQNNESNKKRGKLCSNKGSKDTCVIFENMFITLHVLERSVDVACQ